jgi:hypothetical protein
MSVGLFTPSVEFPLVSFRIVLASPWSSDNSDFVLSFSQFTSQGFDPSDDPVTFTTYDRLHTLLSPGSIPSVRIPHDPYPNSLGPSVPLCL